MVQWLLMFCLRTEKEHSMGSRKRGDILFTPGELISFSIFGKTSWRKCGLKLRTLFPMSHWIYSAVVHFFLVCRIQNFIQGLKRWIPCTKGIFASQNSYFLSWVFLKVPFNKSIKQHRGRHFRNSIKVLYSLYNIIGKKWQKVEKLSLVNWTYFIIFKNWV